MKINLDATGIVSLNGIGVFEKDTSGVIRFSPVHADQFSTFPVAAERVIHQDTQHAILVGDKETTNIAMTGFFKKKKSKQKRRWWVFPLILAVIALGLILFHFYYEENTYVSTPFGNSAPVKPSQMDTQYRAHK